MQLPDGSVLMHDGAPYDPAKAHEYYLKYRKLHPRTGAAATTPAGKTAKAPTFTVTTADKKTVKLSAQQLEEQKVYAAARIKNIQDTLVVLNDALKKKLAAAQKAAEAAKKPPTVAEKAAAIKASEKYANAHKQEIANKAKAAAAKKAPAKASTAPKQANDTVDTLKTKISAAKASLKDAINKQRSLATAKKNG